MGTWPLDCDYTACPAACRSLPVGIRLWPLPWTRQHPVLLPSAPQVGISLLWPRAPHGDWKRKLEWDPPDAEKHSCAPCSASFPQAPPASCQVRLNNQGTWTTPVPINKATSTLSFHGTTTETIAPYWSIKDHENRILSQPVLESSFQGLQPAVNGKAPATCRLQTGHSKRAAGSKELIQALAKILMSKKCFKNISQNFILWAKHVSI